MNEWLQESLVCPRDKTAVKLAENNLECAHRHLYPVVDGVPVMLLDEVEQTHHYIGETLEKVSRQGTAENGVSPAEGSDNGVDGYVQHEIPFTSGFLYEPLQYKLTRYPIPTLRLPRSEGARFLDVGCNWGRWSIAAAQKGYRPVGLDPCLDAVLAARRIAKQLGFEADFVVGDARFLPFADDVFDVAFSHSVFPSFSKDNVRTSLAEVSRVLRHGGTSLMQMPNKFGIRQYQQRRRREFSEGKGFETRYWSPLELKETFEEKIGETKMTVDCFFGLGIQAADIDLLPAHFRVVVFSSEILRRVSEIFPPLIKVADSPYLRSINSKTVADGADDP